MAGQMVGGSIAGSIEGAPLMTNQENGDHHHHEETSLASLARRSTRRNRSIRHKKVLDLHHEGGGLESRRGSGGSMGDQHLHPLNYIPRRRSPSLRRGNSPAYQRSPSPGRNYHQSHHHHHHQHLHHDIGFSDTVSNVVEIVKHEHQRSHYGHKRLIRGSWSASTSPARSPSPVDRAMYQKNYGTTSLCHRSRSPSPTHHPPPHQQGPPLIGAVVGIPLQQSAALHRSVQHSHPVLDGRRGQGRRLPPTPAKPSSLQLRPGSINFPKLNASPTRNIQLQSHYEVRHPNVQQHPAMLHEPPDLLSSTPATAELFRAAATTDDPANHVPLSFEQALAMSRGGRILTSPVPNGYKPKPSSRQRHSDSDDDDDWC